MMMTSGSGVNYKSMFDAGSQIVAKEGTKSLFKGAGANILRGVAGAGVLSLYDKLQQVMFGKVYSGGKSHNLESTRSWLMYHSQDPARHFFTLPRSLRFIHRHSTFYSHYRLLLGMDTLYHYKRLITKYSSDETIFCVNENEQIMLWYRASLVRLLSIFYAFLFLSHYTC
jgi:hypothetical protein